jgi:ParB-like chromosome segregation protein Spo0J
MAGLTKVDCVVKKMTESEIATMAIVENLQRKDVTPLEEANAFKKMLDEGFANDEDGQPSIKVLAQKIGIKQPHRVSERLRLLALIPAAQQAYSDRHITTNAAWYIASLSDERKQQMLLDACLSGKCVTNDRLKATYEALLRKNLDTQVEQSGFDLGLLDPAVQAQINALQKTIETAASALSGLVIDQKLGQVSGSIPSNQAELMAATLANLAATAKQLEKQLIAELVQVA